MATLAFQIKFLSSSTVHRFGSLLCKRTDFHLILARMDICVDCKTTFTAKRGHLQHAYSVPAVTNIKQLILLVSEETSHSPRNHGNLWWVMVCKHTKHFTFSFLHRMCVNRKCLVEELITFIMETVVVYKVILNSVILGLGLGLGIPDFDTYWNTALSRCSITSEVRNLLRSKLCMDSSRAFILKEHTILQLPSAESWRHTWV